MSASRGCSPNAAPGEDGAGEFCFEEREGSHFLCKESLDIYVESVTLHL